MDTAKEFIIKTGISRIALSEISKLIDEYGYDLILSSDMRLLSRLLGGYSFLVKVEFVFNGEYYYKPSSIYIKTAQLCYCSELCYSHIEDNPFSKDKLRSLKIKNILYDCDMPPKESLIISDAND